MEVLLKPSPKKPEEAKLGEKKKPTSTNGFNASHYFESERKAVFKLYLGGCGRACPRSSSFYPFAYYQNHTFTLTPTTFKTPPQKRHEDTIGRQHPVCD